MSLCRRLFFDKDDRLTLLWLLLINYSRLQLYNKRSPAQALPCKFPEILEISSRTTTSKYFWSFETFMRFSQCSQKSWSISPITMRQLPLRSSAKTVIIWHSKQIKTLYNQWFRPVLWNSLSEKIYIYIHRKMSAVESRLYKVMGYWVKPFWYFQSSNSLEHMRMPKVQSWTKHL